MLIVYITYLLPFISYTTSCVTYDDFVENDEDVSDLNSLEDEMKNEIFESKSLEVVTTSEKSASRDNNEENNKKDQHYQDIITGEAHCGRLHEDKCWSTLVDYPYAVSIQKKGAHHATGALLHENWILTSGREFYYARESLKLFRARLGSVNCKKGGRVVPLKEVHLHPSYVPLSPSFDLAIIRSGIPVAYTEYIKPIELPPVTEDVLNARFMTVYWPRLIINGDPLPSSAKERVKYNSMRVSTQKLIPWRYCSKKMNITGEEIGCMQPVAAHHTVCMPDSGAPVVSDNKLWGITSGWTSKTCTSNPSPTVFTRISSRRVRSWLDSILSEDS